MSDLPLRESDTVRQLRYVIAKQRSMLGEYELALERAVAPMLESGDAAEAERRQSSLWFTLCCAKHRTIGALHKRITELEAELKESRRG